MYFSIRLSRFMGVIRRPSKKPTTKLSCNACDIELKHLTRTAMEGAKSQTSDISESMHGVAKVSPYHELAGTRY
jgi:hypothetical protein